MKLGEQNLIDDDGVYTLPALTVTEETLLEITSLDSTFSLTTVNLDLSALMLSATIRVYYKVDGVNYRRRYGTSVSGGVISWTTSDGPWVAIAINGVWDHDIKITVQSSMAGEIAPRDIPYSYVGAR